MWQDTYPVQVNRQEVLIFRSCIRCSSGQGKIEFLTSGQTPVSPEISQQLEEMQQEAQQALDEAEAEKNSVGEAGLAESFIPVWGSGRDMIHSAQTGSWGMAALNAGFLVWDVASVAAGVVSFGTATVAMQGAKAGVRGLIKAGAKVAAKGAARKAAELFAKGVAMKAGLKKGLLKLATTRVCVLACFPAGTSVAVQDGYRNIEELEAGDQVWSRNEFTGKLELNPIVTTMSRETDHLIHVRLGGERIQTTAEHPFYTRQGWQKASTLVVGQEVVRSDGQWVAVTQVDHQTEFSEPVVVYNIEVDNAHTYFVGKWMWWVHNATVCVKTTLQKLLDGRRYLREVEKITNLKVHPKQLEELKKALRNKSYTRLSVEDTEKARKAFASKKNAAIRKWEKETGQKWPRYDKPVKNSKGEVIREVGDPYDAHHIIENTYGGEHEWWNMHPARFPDQHQAGIHGKNGPAKKVFPRKRK